MQKWAEKPAVEKEATTFIIGMHVSHLPLLQQLYDVAVTDASHECRACAGPGVKVRL